MTGAAPLPVPSAGAPGCIAIDLGALRRNWQSLASEVKPAECAAVVKADAYGLGATAVVPALNRAGCNTYFVATLDEARQVRALAPKATLYVLDGLMPATAPQFAEAGATPILSSLDQIEEWAAFAKSGKKTQNAALQIDTGLNRLGLSTDDVAAFAGRKTEFEPLDVTLIMSHLASADDPGTAKNEAQRQTFLKALEALPRARASLAASDGLMLGKNYHFDLVRPGYALYGGQAFQGRPTPVEPVVTVMSKVLQVRNLKPGDSVGYSETFKAQRPMTIAIVAAGYADGIPRHASATTNEQRGCVAIDGTIASMIGRVSMDLIAIDVTHLAKDSVSRGTPVELIGPAISLEQAGQAADTIGYELLTNLSRRFERLYFDTGQAKPEGKV